MSFAGVIVFELGYDGETVRQHEFEGLTFDQVVAAPSALTKQREEARVMREWAKDYKQQRDELITALNHIRGLGDYWGNEGKGLGQYFRDVEETARAAVVRYEEEC